MQVRGMRGGPFSTLKIRSCFDLLQERPHACDQCQYRSTTKGLLDKHLRTVHNKEKPFGCQICMARFGQKAHLQKHVITVHRKEKPYKCELCAYQVTISFKTKKLHWGSEHWTSPVLDRLFNFRIKLSRCYLNTPPSLQNHLVPNNVLVIIPLDFLMYSSLLVTQAYGGGGVCLPPSTSKCLALVFFKIFNRFPPKSFKVHKSATYDFQCSDFGCCNVVSLRGVSHQKSGLSVTFVTIRIISPKHSGFNHIQHVVKQQLWQIN